MKAVKESKGTKAAKKAWKTIRAKQAVMSDKELREVAFQRSQAALKAWETIRANKERDRRSKAAKKAWITIRAKKSA